MTSRFIYWPGQTSSRSRDLAGKKVNFGRRDSGTYITATNIFKALGVEPDVIVLPHPRALDQLRRGELSAMVYVGTKPARMFQDIRPDEKLHFLSITGNVPTDYSAVSIAAEDYPELVSKDAPVNTVEVGTVLVAYNWPDKSERSQSGKSLCASVLYTPQRYQSQPSEVARL